jgi:hypothetical protein
MVMRFFAEKRGIAMRCRGRCSFGAKLLWQWIEIDISCQLSAFGA